MPSGRSTRSSAPATSSPTTSVSSATPSARRWPSCAAITTAVVDGPSRSHRERRNRSTADGSIWSTACQSSHWSGRGFVTAIASATTDRPGSTWCAWRRPAGSSRSFGHAGRRAQPRPTARHRRPRGRSVSRRLRRVPLAPRSVPAAALAARARATGERRGLVRRARRLAGHQRHGGRPVAAGSADRHVRATTRIAWSRRVCR